MIRVYVRKGESAHSVSKHTLRMGMRHQSSPVLHSAFVLLHILLSLRRVYVGVSSTGYQCTPLLLLLAPPFFPLLSLAHVSTCRVNHARPSSEGNVLTVDFLLLVCAVTLVFVSVCVCVCLCVSVCACVHVSMCMYASLRTYNIHLH